MKQPTPRQAYAAAKRAEARAWKALNANWTIANKAAWISASKAVTTAYRATYLTPPATGQKVKA